MTTIRLNLLSFLSKQERRDMLQNVALAAVHCQLSCDSLMIQGCSELVDLVSSRQNHHYTVFRVCIYRVQELGP